MDQKSFAELVDSLMIPKDGCGSGATVMVVVNEAAWPEDFALHKMYCCPATENDWEKGYRHYPARYIGNYVSKGVRYIGVVGACVHLRKDHPDRVLWKYDDISDEEAIAEAERVRKATNRNPRPCIVFLQTQLSATDFQYDVRGGLQSSRIYFDVSSLEPRDVKDLAAKLRERPWSEVPKLKRA